MMMQSRSETAVLAVQVHKSGCRDKTPFAAMPHGRRKRSFVLSDFCKRDTIKRIGKFYEERKYEERKKNEF